MRLRTWLIAISVLVSAVAGVGLAYSYPYLMIAAAFKAQMLCVGVLQGGRPEAQVLAQDASGYGYLYSSIDHELGEVSVSLLGTVGRKAQFQPGWGCRLPFGLDKQLPEVAPISGDFTGAVVKSDNADLTRAAQAWFESDLNTHAVLVMRAGEVVHEVYADGINANTPLIGWSMTKGIVHAAIGRLIQQGLLDSVDEPTPQPLWQHRPDDPRGKITLDILLRMSSGLAWDEDYGTVSDVNLMLLASRDTSRFAADKPLGDPVGSRWQYSSGTSNILSAAIARLAPDLQQPTRSLVFEPLGMSSAYTGVDARGNEVGSSLVAASARDWGKFGQLYLQDGLWNGEQFLPQGWVAHARKPTQSIKRADRKGRYGAHWWLNPVMEETKARYYPEMPQDSMSAEGFNGQYIFVIPSKDVVLVRLGATAPSQERLSKLMGGILTALDGANAK